MTILSNLFYFIVALGVLVTVHEFGHFWVARKLGVKVLTFSVGFGNALWERTAKDGVRYVIATIPLGGYVKMLDEREGEVAEEDLPYAFNRKSVWTRMAIVLAGPVANFILAIFLYWWVFSLGIVGLNTELGEIEPTSIAGKAGLHKGDIVQKVDGEPVVLWQDFHNAIILRIGDKDHLNLVIHSSQTNSEKLLSIPLENWQADTSRPRVFDELGIRHKYQDIVIPALITKVNPDTPAERAGLQIGDKVKAYNNQAISNWDQLVAHVEADQGQLAKLLIERDGELTEVSVVIGSHNKEGKQVGYLGVSPQMPNRSEYVISRQGSFSESMQLALIETKKMISLTVRMFEKLITGDISPKSLSGPFSIAEGAGSSARSGLVAFLSFIALISVNLGFINLLPIPMLDGGHFLFYVIEAIKGKPLSQRVQEIGMQIGMLMVFCLMAIAIFNDLSRSFA